MPIRVLVNNCAAYAALFAEDGGVSKLLDALAAKGAEYGRASLGQGPEVSSPGESPNTQSGDLDAGITSEANRTLSNSEHSGFLELGTRKMATRPFLLKSCLKTATDVEALAREHLGL